MNTSDIFYKNNTIFLTLVKITTVYYDLPTLIACNETANV